MFYVAVTLGLSLACATGTWFFYRIFLEYVNRFDSRMIERWNREAQRRDRFSSLAEEPHSETLECSHPSEDEFWSELIDD